MAKGHPIMFDHVCASDSYFVKCSRQVVAHYSQACVPSGQSKPYEQTVP